MMPYEFPWEPADERCGGCSRRIAFHEKAVNTPPPPKSAQKYSTSTSGDLQFYTSFNLVGNVALFQKDGCNAACNGELSRSTYIYIFVSFCIIMYS